MKKILARIGCVVVPIIGLYAEFYALHVLFEGALDLYWYSLPTVITIGGLTIVSIVACINYFVNHDNR